MKKLREILGEDKKSDTTGLQIGPVKFRKASDIGSDIMSGLGSAGSAVGTAFNQVLNPVRRAVGVEPGKLPPGTKEVDYGSMAKSALGVLDTAMSGFGGADPGKNSRKPQKAIPHPESKKIQDRVPQEVTKIKPYQPPAQPIPMAKQREKSGDTPPAELPIRDRMEMMRLKNNVEFDRSKKEMENKFQSAKLAAASNEKAPVDKTKLEPKVAAKPVVSQTGFPAAKKLKAPIPKAKPEQSEITIQPKQKIWDIAGGDPKRVKEILKLNPGLNPKKMPIGYKLKLK